MTARSALLAFALIGFPHLSAALVTAVNPVPGQKPLPVSTTSPLVAVRWNLQVVTSVGTAPQSPRAFLRAGPAGPVLHTVERVLGGVAPATGPSTLGLSESVRIPPDVWLRAREQGIRLLVLEREFADVDNGAPVAGSMRLPLSGAKGGAFEISRLELEFDDGRALRVVAREGALHPVAEIHFEGSGRLEAQWEIADSASTSGAAVFRPLLRTRERLDLGGRKRLVGPRLPTTGAGLHIVRLAVVEPELRFEPRAIRYWVRADAPPTAAAELGVDGPQSGARLDADTVFAWIPVPGARVYQLEFLEPGPASRAGLPADDVPPRQVLLEPAPGGPGAHVLGVTLAPERTSRSLPASVRARLMPGRTYLWRMRAYSEQGVELAASQPRAISIPPGTGEP
jgi:hypothetical protein